MKSNQLALMLAYSAQKDTTVMRSERLLATTASLVVTVSVIMESSVQVARNRITQPLKTVESYAQSVIIARVAKRSLVQEVDTQQVLVREAATSAPKERSAMRLE